MSTTDIRRPECTTREAAAPVAAFSGEAQVAGATVEETGRLRQVRRFTSAGEAAAALEYAILVGIAAVATIVLLTAFSGEIGTAMDRIAANLMGTAGRTGR